MHEPSSSSSSTPTLLLAIPRSEVAFVADLDDARRLAQELEPAATGPRLEQRAADILAGRVLVVLRAPTLALDAVGSDAAPPLASLAEVG
jgi:hypothetical protein